LESLEKSLSHLFLSIKRLQLINYEIRHGLEAAVMSFNLLLIISVLIGISAIIYAYSVRRRNYFLKISLDDALHKKAEIENFLSIFSKNLRTVEEIEDSMNMTARYVADLIGAHALAIFILDEEGLLRATGISGAFPPLHKSPDYVLTKPRYILESLRREKIRIGDGIIGEVAQNREGLLIEDGSEDLRITAIDNTMMIETLMAVPMVQEGKVFGVICAVNNRLHGRAFRPEQFSNLKFMASQVILANNIVKVYANLSRQQRISQELEFARQLQASLLPKEFPEWDQFQVYAFARSAKEVSGDFYDFVKIDDDRLLVVIGDACGKGIPACMLMAMTRSFIRANVERFTTLNALLSELNNNLYRDTVAERFVTVAFCLLDRSEGTVEYARAGHTELLIHLPQHQVRQICPNGSALGLLPGEVAEDYDILSFLFLPKMSLLCFTDGISEALNEQEDEFGLDRLIQVFHEAYPESGSPQEAVEKVLQAVDEFTGDYPRFDDQTMVIISCREDQ